MLIPVVFSGLLLMVLERIFPDQILPESKGWWKRVVIINIFQLGIVYVAMRTWDRWFVSYQPFKLEMAHPAFEGFLSYLVITFVFYWWHRWRHDVNALWLVFHQIHHSATRIETITSYYKHPLEIVVNSWIIGTINFILLGISLDAAAWCLLYTSLAEYFYHMNIRTPHWVGHFIQRPEMHRIHHQQGKHYNNFSDLPVWDKLFGTHVNPPTYQGLCGYKPEREVRFLDMLLFKNVNNPFPRQ